jgi:hypothetical protein
VPQGSVISPHLFNVFIHNFPSHAEVNELYPDNFHLAESSSDADTLGPVLTEHLKQVSKWTRDNKLGISSNKSSVTLFSLHNKQANFHPEVYIDGNLIPLAKHVKLLGNTLSNSFSTSTQIGGAKSKGNSRIQLMKATSRLDFGNKETLKLTYDAYVKPVMSTGAHIWFPNTNPDASFIAELQRIVRVCVSLQVVTR